MKGSLVSTLGRIIPECLLSLILKSVLESGLYMQSACLIIKRLRAGCIVVPVCRPLNQNSIASSALLPNRCSFFPLFYHSSSRIEFSPGKRAATKWSFGLYCSFYDATEYTPATFPVRQGWNLISCMCIVLSNSTCNTYILVYFAIYNYMVILNYITRCTDTQTHIQHTPKAEHKGSAMKRVILLSNFYNFEDYTFSINDKQINIINGQALATR